MIDRSPSILTTGQRQALRNLKTNENIVIKPTDKGGVAVIQETKDYINEAKLGPMASRADPSAYQATTNRTKIFDLARQHG